MAWDELTDFDEARALVPPLGIVAERTRRFLAGDYWQGGNCWAGTKLPADAANRRAVMQEIEDSFVPQPLVQEVARRHLAGVVGREPGFWLVERQSSAEGG